MTTKTAGNWILGLLGAGAVGTGYVLWRRHREQRMLPPGGHHRGERGRHGRRGKHDHGRGRGNDRGEYGGGGHHHHGEHGHGE